MAWKEQKEGGVVGRKASREKRGPGGGGGGPLLLSPSPSPFFPPPSPFDSCPTVVSYMHMLQMSLPLE